MIKCFTIIQELELEDVGFCGEGKTGKHAGLPGEKTLGARTRTNNKLNPYMTLGPLVAGERSHHCANPRICDLLATFSFGSTPERNNWVIPLV